MSIKEETETDKILLYVTFTPQKTSDIRLVCLAMYPLRLLQPIFGDLDLPISPATKANEMNYLHDFTVALRTDNTP